MLPQDTKISSKDCTLHSDPWVVFDLQGYTFNTRFFCLFGLHIRPHGGIHFNKEPLVRPSSLAFLKHECRQCWKHLLLSCALQMLLSILCTLVTCHRVPTLLSGVWLFLCLLESFVFRLHNRNTSKPVATWLPKLLQSFINLLTKDLNSERKGCFELVGYWSRHAEKPLPNPLSSLIYLTRTRPDLSFVVRVVSRFMQDPKESHL